MKLIIGIVLVVVVVGGAILIIYKSQIRADTVGESAISTATASVYSTATVQSVDIDPPAPATASSL